MVRKGPHCCGVKSTIAYQLRRQQTAIAFAGPALGPAESAQHFVVEKPGVEKVVAELAATKPSCLSKQ